MPHSTWSQPVVDLFLQVQYLEVLDLKSSLLANSLPAWQLEVLAKLINSWPKYVFI